MDVFMEKYYPFITRECGGERERVSSHRKSILNSLNLKTSFICLNVLCTPAFFCVYCQWLIKFYFLFARPHLWDLIYCVTAFFPIRTVFFFNLNVIYSHHLGYFFLFTTQFVSEISQYIRVLRSLNLRYLIM